jgi:hypothetical protein
MQPCHHCAHHLSGVRHPPTGTFLLLGCPSDACCASCPGPCSNGYLEPAELAAFLRRLVRGMSAREQHYLLMHLAGMDVTGEGTVGGIQDFQQSVCSQLSVHTLTLACCGAHVQ